MTLAQRLKQHAQQLGFDLVGIAAAREADGFAHFRAWLDQGYAGEMGYLERHAAARQHPESVFPDVRSVVMLAMSYQAREPAPVARELAGRVARYAWGADYHDVLRERLNQLLAWVRSVLPGCCGRGVVDTAPLLERDFARRAGLGWFGKNTMLINKHRGSYTYLGALLLDFDLPPDPPHDTSHCGTCTACLDTCPTQAFVAPGVLDARRCISYLTIELRGQVPLEHRREMSDWIFGCDICQEVCPWNRKAASAANPALQPREELLALDPVEILGLSEVEFRQRFRGTALLRSKRRGLARNAAIVLGNRGTTSALPALRRALNDPEVVVREAAAWAIAEIERRAQSRVTGAPPLATPPG